MKNQTATILLFALAGASTPLAAQDYASTYQPYYTDALTSIITSKWTQNGIVSATSGGLTATSSYGGSLISSMTVPDGSSDYDVATTLTLAGTGGTYVSYLRATPDAQTGPGPTAGTFYSVELTPTFYGSTCYATIALNKRVGGQMTLLTTTQIYCHSGMIVHAWIRTSTNTNTIGVIADRQPCFVITDASITTGKGGVGAAGTPTGNSIYSTSLGHIDRVAPNAPNPATFATSVLPTRLDLTFAGVTDDSIGTGVAAYWFYRDGVWLGGSVTPEYSDQTLSPGTSHTYLVYALDFHWNLSTMSSFNITTPPATSVDPRRIGVRPTGAYWGGAGEQLDVLSGNLNFTLPLLRAQMRGGSAVPFALTYNSQNWRQDSSNAWNLGEDVGYGYGWKLLAGSLTPYYYGSWSVDHYVFTDSTGAEYRLDQNNSGVWTSRESLYVWFNWNNNTLYFRDGSYWAMGCASAGSEPDAGAMYPTVMENTNGNQVIVSYFPGNTLPWINSSARIQSIRDVRAIGQVTYTFTYNTDPIPHLTSIQNMIGTSEGYQFTYWAPATLVAPFKGSNYSLPGGLTGLHTVMVVGITTQYYFYYDQSGEMIETVFPYLGYFKWVYGSATYSSGFTQNEVISRYMSKDGNINTEVAYPFTHESSTGLVHQFTKLNDPGGVGQKYWAFSTSNANIGLLTQYQGIQLPSTTLTQNDFTWAQDTSLNFYIGSTQNTFYPGPAVSKTNQTVDIYGNVTQVQKYNFGSLNTPARTYTYSYLNSSPYTSNYIFNRLTAATVTDGTTNVTLASNSYDPNGNYSTLSPTPQEWDTAYANVRYRGNVSVSTTPNGTNYYYYDQTGNVTSANVNGVATSVTNDSTNNYGAPTAITTGSLMNTLTYAPFLGLTSDTGPNNASASTTYDTYARPSQTTSPFGATTTYTYAVYPAPTVTATTNNHWTRQTLDGFGRTIKTEAGDNVSTQSVSESVYGPCACSPLGKLIQQSIPHAPNGTSATTTYTYDGVGRTLSVATAGSDTQGTSSYAYTFAGNAQWITAWDPSGNYKYFLTDAFNNLIAVSENAGTIATYYSYDLLDHLTTVSMPRSNGTQIRTFVYSGNFLTSATNPENGTVTYTYNNYNKVATKTDAKHQQIVYTYDALARLTKVQRFPTANNEDLCQQENYYYDTNPYDSNYSQNSNGRLTAVQYTGRYSTASGWFSCDTTFIEMYNYNPAGAKVGKRLRLSRAGLPWYYNPYTWSQLTYATGIADLNSTYTYDNEGRMTSVQYPSYSSFGQTQPGPNLQLAYDSMGRLNTITDQTLNSSVISGATYGPAGQLLTMSGSVSETRTYNSMLQLTQLQQFQSGGVNISYGYPSTQNNGKISSQTDHSSGEQVVYTYDAMNRLLTAQATSNSWGQGYVYDGFGNLTNQNVIAGTAPAYGVSYDPTTNRIVGESADANGNIGSGNGYTYDVENRMISAGMSYAPLPAYTYAPGNKRVRHTVSTYDPPTESYLLTTDEVAFWSVTGQKLATYSISVQDGNGPQNPPQLLAMQTGTNYYFGGRMIKNAGGYVGSDRLGSIGKFYPWGQEKPSATTNGTEKFTGYFRDAETGLDYANQRYHSPGQGRFMTPDSLLGSGMPASPGSWNRYAYVTGDPINLKDPSGRVSCDDWDPDSGGCDDEGGGGGGGCYIGDFVPNPVCGDPGPIGPDPDPPPPATSCIISVAYSGMPRDGQNLVGLTNYSPTSNKLGKYSTVGRPGGGPQGWFFAVQIQANLFGDVNPSDWVATQTLVTSGSFSIQGRSTPITGTIPSNPDNPEIGINIGTTGRFDWIDEPGFPNMQLSRRLISADLTDTFTSTLTNKNTGEHCSVTWSVHFTFKNGQWNFIHNWQKGTPVVNLRIDAIILFAFCCVAASAQNERDSDLARLLSNDETRESAVARVRQEGSNKIPQLLAWTRNPPEQVDRFELYIGLAEAFGELKAKEGIPFLIKNISLQRGSLNADTWMKTPEVIEARRPAVAALIKIGPEASKALIRGAWDRMAPEDRLAAIFVISRVKDVPEARAFLSSVSGQANMERYWAEEGLKLLNGHR